MMRPGKAARRDAIVVLVGLIVSLVAGACVSVTRVGDGSLMPSADPALASPGTVLATASPAAASASASPSAESSLSAEASIGFLSLDGSLPFAQAVGAGIRTAAEGAGVPLVECDPGWTREGVLDCAGRLRDAGVHGIISFQPFLDLADDVCAITGDRPTIGVVFDQGPCQVARLDIDQARSGRLAGEAVGAFAGRRWDCDVAAYVSLESSDADPDGRARMEGYRDGYAAHCPLPDRVITLDNADRLLTARTQMTARLDRLRGRPIVVVGLNESAILGAMAAAEQAGRTGDLWYSGQLADPAIRGHIACDPRYIASVAQFPERFGDQLVPALMAALEGGEVPARMLAEMELVTATNVRRLFPDTEACHE